MTTCNERWKKLEVVEGQKKSKVVGEVGGTFVSGVGNNGEVSIC